MATRTRNNHGARAAGSGADGARPTKAQLEQTFRTLTSLLYDTEVPLETLEERVVPYLAPDVAFADPWLTARGIDRIRTGMRGFHCAFRFDFTIAQLDVRLDDDSGRGRVLVDGVMSLRSIPGYTYPLRTLLVYELELHGGEPRITSLEEMWSYADMIRHAPFLVGRFYDRVFRPAAGIFFWGFFWLACKVRGGPRGSRASA